MKRMILFGSGVSLLGIVGLGTLVIWPIGLKPNPIELIGDVDRGAYLARASGCIACHTDFEAVELHLRVV